MLSNLLKGNKLANEELRFGFRSASAKSDECMLSYLPQHKFYSTREKIFLRL